MPFSRAEETNFTRSVHCALVFVRIIAIEVLTHTHTNIYVHTQAFVTSIGNESSTQNVDHYHKYRVHDNKLQKHL